jgi:hypothetical protein
MGKKLLKEMDRVVSTVSASETRRPQQETSGAVVMGGGHDSSSNIGTQNGKLRSLNSRQCSKIG